MILCPRCKRDSDDDARFCKYCGNRVGSPNPGPEEFYGQMTRSSLGLMEIEELPPHIQQRRTALTRLWIVASLVVLVLCTGILFAACVPFLLGM